MTFVPMSAVDEVMGEIAEPEIREIAEVRTGYTSFLENDVLFAKITPCMQNGKAAIARGLLGGRGFGSTEFHVLRAGPSILPEWLFLYIRAPFFLARAEAAFSGSAGQQRVPAEFLKVAPIPVPPLSEQRRIVAILEEARAVRRLRRRADELTARLTPAIFHEMFGDPIVDFPTTTLGEVVEEFRYGTSTASGDDGYTTLRIPNVIGNDVSYDDLVKVSLTQQEFEKLVLHDGDLLFVRTNGNPEFIGRSATFSSNRAIRAGQDGHAIVFASYLIRGRLKPDIMHPDVLLAYLRTVRGRMDILRRAKTSAGQYNINIDGLKSVPVPILPPNQQKHFTSRLSAVRGIDEHMRGYALLKDLNDSLLAHAFSGELTAEWRVANRESLEHEAMERDAILKSAGVKLVKPTTPPTVGSLTRSGRFADLSREQRQLFDQVAYQGHREAVFSTFTVHSMREWLESPLHELADDALRRHLDVLVARGLVKLVSRPAGEVTGSPIEEYHGTGFGNMYYLVRENSTDEQQSDLARMEELARLARVTESWTQAAGSWADQTGSWSDEGKEPGE